MIQNIATELKNFLHFHKRKGLEKKKTLAVAYQKKKNTFLTSEIMFSLILGSPHK